jgi:xanthine/CO dehydrogenase XdhC/CoxF family maturation factor
MTDGVRADRIAALRNRQSSASRRRRPAEAARVLVAGAGTAAMLAMTAAMARHDQANEAAIAATPPLVLTAQTVDPRAGARFAPAPEPSTAVTSSVGAVIPAQTVTVVRPTRTVNARTNASR